MGFIPTITCRKCRKQYSGLLKTCPHCGARRQSVSTRPAATTDSTQRSSPAAARSAQNNKWQLIFGLILISAVVLSIIVLITANLNGREQEKDNPGNNSGVISPPPSIAPSPVVPETPTPPPVVAPTSIKIFYLTNPLDSGFTTVIGEATQLSASVYPLDVAATIEWRSTDENVCTVDSTGKVTGVSAGKATIIAECAGIQAESLVIVKQSW